MLEDLTIDTNVLVHAGSPDEKFQADSLDLLLQLYKRPELYLCVDEGFDLNESTNSSFIGSEYIQHLRAGSPGYETVAALARSGRVKFLKKNPAEAARKKIIHMIRKKRDRVFLGVACNSVDKILASHDFEDFQATKRPAIKKTFGVRVLTAQETVPLVNSGDGG